MTMREVSLRASLSMIEAFGNIFGLRLSNEKTEALLIDSKRNSDLKLCPAKRMKCSKHKGYGSQGLMS